MTTRIVRYGYVPFMIVVLDGATAATGAAALPAVYIVGVIAIGTAVPLLAKRRPGKPAKRSAVRPRRAAAWPVTYDGFAAACPDMEHEEGLFAERMNSMPKYVASRTLTDMEWNASLLEGDAVEQVNNLKRDSEQNLLI